MLLESDSFFANPTDFYVGFGFLTFILESLFSSFIALRQYKISHAKVNK